MSMRAALGATGLTVSRFGLGLAALGRPGYLNLGHGEDLPAERSVADLERRTHAVLDAARAAGITYVDAARSYGRAEAFLARWLAGRPPGDVVVASKWGYTYTAGWRVDAEQHEVKDHSPATLRRQVAETRATLGRLPDIYQVHSATLSSGVLDDAETLAALADLAAQGVAVGLTLSGPEQAATLRRALDLTAAGRAPFRIVQATWNLLEPSVGPALAEARAAGWGVVVKEALANGRLGPRGDAATALGPLAEQHGVGVDAVALAVVLAQPFCDVVLSGASTPEQVVSNVRALDVALDGVERDRLAGLAEDPVAYWRRRGALPWT
jgi:aryl-alcohol dehydrogenase-like predicted oxidoreductase